MSEDKLEIELTSTCSKQALIELLESTIEGVKAAEAKKLKIKMEIKQLE